MANAIIDTFELWTTAQNLKTSNRGIKASNQNLLGIKKLREFILELAVHGKLVPQNPIEKPAKELLKEIDILKKRLIKEGAIRKQPSFPQINNDEIPFSLPLGWEWARVGEIGNIFNGNSINAKVKETKYTNNGVGLPFIATKDVGYGWEILNYDNGIVIPKNEKGFSVAHEGAVFVCAEGGSAGKKCGITVKDVCFGNKLFAAELYGKIISKYLLANYLSPTFFDQFSKNMNGIIGGISLLKFIQLIIPIPPISEQNRIVAKIDELMAFCDQLEQQQTISNEAHQTLVDTLLGTLTNAKSPEDFDNAWQRIANHFDTLLTTEHSIDQLKQTILQLAVMGKLVPQNPDDEPASELLKKIAKEKAKLVKDGKIKKQKPLLEIEENEKLNNLPRSWEISRLGTFTIVGTGSTPSRDKGQYYFPQEFNWVSSGETNQDFIIETDEKISSLALKETNVSIYPIGSLIVAMYGQGKTRGQVSELMIEAGTNQACAAIVLINKEESHRKYLKYFFKKAYEELRSHAAGGAQPNLNLGKVANTVIPLPPIAEQQRIVLKVDELFALCDALKECMCDAQELQNQLAVAVVEQAV